MPADARELLIQLIVGTVCAVAFAVISLRARTHAPHARGHAGLRVGSAIVVTTAIIVLGILEARLLAALVAGAAAGILFAGVAARVRARTLRSGGMLRPIAALLVAVLPLPAMHLSINGISVFELTHEAAATSGGNWLVAWRRSWELVLDTSAPDGTLALTIAWMLVLVAAFAATARAWIAVTGRSAVPPIHTFGTPEDPDTALA